MHSWRAALFLSLLCISHMNLLLGFSLDFVDDEGPRPFRSEEEVSWLYEEWRLKFDKTYESHREKAQRFEIFKDNLRYIDEQNHPKNNHTYTLGLNSMADLSFEEFQAKYLMSNVGESFLSLPGSAEELEIEEPGDEDLEQVPESIDWRLRGSVSPVVDQGECGSCWTWAATGAVESLHHIRTGQMIRLSAQQLLDCERKSLGCGGGWLAYAFQYIKDHGIDAADNYPYTGVQGNCKQNTSRVVSIDGWHRVKSGDAPVQWAVSRQPVAFVSDAKARDFVLYKRGVFNGKCAIDTNHVMLIVGYGSENGQDFWIVKNSWNFNWGEDGYVRMARNTHTPFGQCGMLIQPVFPSKM